MSLERKAEGDLYTKIGNVTTEAETGVLTNEFQQLPEARRNKKRFFL